jgi:starch-binding outer membrane protein, SusD/RagB family
MRIVDPSTSDMWGYAGVTQSRGFIRDAIASMQQYNPDSSSMIGELYAELGFFEMTLADNFCNGIPLGHTTNGVIVYGAPLTDAQVYDSASAHLDTALAYSSKKTDTYSVYVNRLARVWKARVLTDLGQYATAATYVPVATVPTTFTYDMTFSATGGTNAMYGINTSTARVGVADSFSVIGGQKAVIKNALPFGSSGDPRVQVVLGSTVGAKPEDQVTSPFYVSNLWKTQFDPMVLASGVDARLTEAEAKLAANDIPGMMAILNDLRTNPTRPVIGLITIPVMPALATPATKDDALTLLFRERGFWTFGRGQRLADLRRLVRQYGRTDSQVFPTGLYFKGGSYGTDENIPVPNSEEVNPLFHGCLDRKA